MSKSFGTYYALHIPTNTVHIKWWEESSPGVKDVELSHVLIYKLVELNNWNYLAALSGQRPEWMYWMDA